MRAWLCLSCCCCFWKSCLFCIICGCAWVGTQAEQTFLGNQDREKARVGQNGRAPKEIYTFRLWKCLCVKQDGGLAFCWWNPETFTRCRLLCSIRKKLLKDQRCILLSRVSKRIDPLPSAPPLEMLSISQLLHFHTSFCLYSIGFPWMLTSLSHLSLSNFLYCAYTAWALFTTCFSQSHRPSTIPVYTGWLALF